MFCWSVAWWLLARDSSVQMMCALKRFSGFVWGKKEWGEEWRSTNCVCVCVFACVHGCFALIPFALCVHLLTALARLVGLFLEAWVPTSSSLMIFTWPLLVTETHQLTVIWGRTTSHKYSPLLRSGSVLVRNTWLQSRFVPELKLV